MSESGKNRILFRVEGNDLVGHGHFMRCLTIARYLQNDFECVFAMSWVSDWVISQLNEHNLSVIDLPIREQFHPDDPRSEEPWNCDVAGILQPSDVMILDGYRFDSTFHLATKRIGAATIRIIDDLKGPVACDAIITQLPIAHSEVQAKLGLDNAWTGLDGFLVRPEFYAAQKIEAPTYFDFFIYVSTSLSLEFYSNLAMLKNKKVLAMVSSTFVEQCEAYEWVICQQLSAQEIALRMKESANAILPASSIAIEFLVATRKRPVVVPFVTNQVFSCDSFVHASLWKENMVSNDARVINEINFEQCNLPKFIYKISSIETSR